MAFFLRNSNLPFRHLKITSRFSSSASAHTDCLIIGCGVAGSSAALQLANSGKNVTMLSSSDHPSDCNSFFAQGGIIYRGNNDTPSRLASDVHKAGAGICYDPAVMKMASDGPFRVEDLLLEIAKVPFDRAEDGSLSLCLEASHNCARIIHWQDRTGAAITECLQREVLNHPRVTFRANTTAVDLMTSGPGETRVCDGAYCLDNITGEVFAVRASATVLATGGLGEIFQYTSNPQSARGDGFAIAHRSGAALLNMEYVQFHPTTLNIPGERRFLLTEALRGEGAILRNDAGEAFAKRYHPDGELAPRDVVARTILSEMRRTGAPHAWLDITHRDPTWLRERFPTIHAHALAHGNLDMTKDWLPVVPAAHYFCGGVGVDLRGRTSLEGLYAAGEVSCTGVHGANRLASTSLLEALVWGAAIADDVVLEQQQQDGASAVATRQGERLRDATAAGTTLRLPPSKPFLGVYSPDNHFSSRGSVVSSSVPVYQPVGVASSGWSLSEGGGLSSGQHAVGNTDSATTAPLDVTERMWERVQTIMWENVGIERDARRLKEACDELARLQNDSELLFAGYAPSFQTVSLRNAVTTARLVAEAALANPRSVGTHYRADSEDQ